MDNWKGTKGKWAKKYFGCDPEMFIFSDSHRISIIPNYDSNYEQKANALLISKAPEMLDMLKQIKDYLAKGSYKRAEVEQLIKEATELYSTPEKTELLYPEFIKLFEEPTKLPSELLKEYFKNTPREQVLKDWESTAYLDNANSPKIRELFEGGEGEKEIDIEKMAKEALKFQHKNIQDRMIDFVLGFEEGFKKAMELNSNQ